MGTDLRAIIRKEFIQALREPRMRVLLFVPPMMQLLVFGFAVNLDVDHARIAWMDHGPHAAEPRAARRASQARAASTSWRRRAAKRRCSACWTAARWTAVVRVLPGFARDMARGRGTSVQVLLDGTNSNTASLVSSLRRADRSRDYSSGA